MNTAPLSIIAPGLIEQDWSEASVLGSATWLWMHSKSHRNFPLHTLPVLLLPAIKHRQFIVASVLDECFHTEGMSAACGSKLSKAWRFCQKKPKRGLTRIRWLTPTVLRRENRPLTICLQGRKT